MEMHKESMNTTVCFAPHLQVMRSLVDESKKYRDNITPLMFKLYGGEKNSCINEIASNSEIYQQMLLVDKSDIDKSEIEDTIIRFAEHYNELYTEFEDIKDSFSDTAVVSDVYSLTSTINSSLKTTTRMINLDRQQCLSKRLSKQKLQKFTQLFTDDENIFDENIRTASVPERLNLIKNKILKVRTLMMQKKSDYHFENINHIEAIDTYYNADSSFVSMVLHKYLSDAMNFVDHIIDHDETNFETFKKLYQDFTTYMTLKKKFDAEEITLTEFESFHFDFEGFSKQIIEINGITNELFGRMPQI